jgi:hypothetical protein
MFIFTHIFQEKSTKHYILTALHLGTSKYVGTIATKYTNQNLEITAM